MAHVCFFPALCFYSQSTFIRPLITNVKLTEVKHVSFKTDQAKRAAQMTTNITLTVSIKVFEWLKKTGSTVNQNHEDTYIIVISLFYIKRSQKLSISDI